MMYCKYCGKLIPEGSKFCKFCGKSLQDVSDNIPDLVKLAERNDQAATTKLYSLTYQKAQYLAKGLLKDEDAANDVVQDSYIKAFANLPNLEDPSKFQSWVDTIVINTAKNELRKKQPVLFSELKTDNDDNEESTDFEDTDDTYSPEANADYAETRRLIQEMIDSLPDTQRIATTLYYMEDMSVNEIAAYMGCSDGTVKSRLNLARKNLKIQVEDLEKKGTKLYCAPLLPFLFWFFRQQVAAVSVPAITASAFTAAAGSAGASAAGASASGSAVVGTGAATTAGTGAAAGTGTTTAAGTGAAVHAAGLGIGTKVLIGVTIATVTLSGGIIGKTVVEYKNNSETAITSEYHAEKNTEKVINTTNQEIETKISESKVTEHKTVVKSITSQTLTYTLYDDGYLLVTGDGTGQTFSAGKALGALIKDVKKVSKIPDGVTSMEYAFEDPERGNYHIAYNLIDISEFATSDFSKVTSFAYAFENCQNLSDITSLKDIDTSSVTNMESMFRGAAITDLSPLAKWDVSKVTNLVYFAPSDVASLHGLENWDVSAVTDCAYAFAGCGSLTDISALSSWKLQSAKNLRYMFTGCKSLTNLSGIGNFDMAKATDTRGMFEHCTGLTDVSAISGWTLSSIADMVEMFRFDATVTDFTCLNGWNVQSSVNQGDAFFQRGDGAKVPSWYTGK